MIIRKLEWICNGIDWEREKEGEGEKEKVREMRWEKPQMGLRLQKMREGWEHKKKERRYFIYQPIKSTENASYKSILM